MNDRVARVIPCLDVTEGRVVKGVNFVGLRDAGDPVELAQRYDDQGADELVFLDITASSDHRATTIEMVERVAEQVFLPFTVGGGIRTLDDARRMLRAGADKVSVNTAAVERRELISEIADVFGTQCVVCAVDARQTSSGSFEVFLHGGRTPTGIDAVEWAAAAVELGARTPPQDTRHASHLPHTASAGFSGSAEPLSRFKWHLSGSRTYYSTCVKRSVKAPCVPFSCLALSITTRS